MATNDLYQSTFMPIFQKAETKIKMLVLAAFLLQEPILGLRLKIDGVIKWATSQVPTELHDKMAYLRGLKFKSEQFIKLYYKKPTLTYKVAREDLLRSVPKGKTPPKIENPMQLIENVHNPSNLWAEAKGSPNVVNYEKELRTTLKRMAQDPVTTYEPGKHPISLWQKAELDVRWENQIQKLQDLRVKGVELAWLSSHPNCSKRCECWQGELVSLTKSAPNPQKKVDKKFNYKKDTFVVDEIDGHKVYSLYDIMDVDGAYGYKNNIYNGFNCRHRLIPYQKGVVGPKDYDAKDVAKQREIEAKMREMEREIRQLKTQVLLLKKAGQIKVANSIENRVKILVVNYKKFCETNGYAWYKYRIDI